MEAMTISRVSREFNVSVRMLRYYEQEGLLKSFRREDYAYRMFDETALVRLRQILILRRLRIPVKQIKTVLGRPDAVDAIEVFRRNIAELDEEIAALSTIRELLIKLVEELGKSTDIKLHRFLTQDKTVLSAIEALSLTGINFKEDKSMDKLQKAEARLSKLTDVRIVYLPPAAVAAAHCIGDEPEERAGRILEEFMQKTDLMRLKPDVRQYGFNHPNPVDETNFHGYEFWVTIPEDLEVPPPMEKKSFPGGMYAAHMIPFGSFNEWDWLFDWVMKNDKYDFAGDAQDHDHMWGCLEEHLNLAGHLAGLDNVAPRELQLDLLVPVKVRSK